MYGTAQDGKMSEFSRLFGVIISPVRTFQDIARKPTWVFPLILTIVIGVVANAALLPRFDWEGTVYEALEQRGVELEEAQIESQVEIMQRFGTVFGYLGAVLGPLVAGLVFALVFWAIVRIGKGALTYVATFSVVLWSGIVSLVKAVLITVAGLTRESFTANEVVDLVPSHAAAFMDRESVGAPLYVIGQQLDIFTIWWIALMIVGLSCASNWSRGKCAAAVIVPWAVWILGRAAMAAAFGG